MPSAISTHAAKPRRSLALMSHQTVQGIIGLANTGVSADVALRMHKKIGIGYTH